MSTMRVDHCGARRARRAIGEELLVHLVEYGEVPSVAQVARALDDQVLAAARRDTSPAAACGLDSPTRPAV
jgi:hypothetical protein